MVATHDLSKGVILGVLLSAIFFMRKVGKTVAVTEIETPEEGVLRYRVTGPAVLRLGRPVRRQFRTPRPPQTGRNRHDRRPSLGPHRGRGGG